MIDIQIAQIDHLDHLRVSFGSHRTARVPCCPSVARWQKLPHSGQARSRCRSCRSSRSSASQLQLLVPGNVILRACRIPPCILVRVDDPPLEIRQPGLLLVAENRQIRSILFLVLEAPKGQYLKSTELMCRVKQLLAVGLTAYSRYGPIGLGSGFGLL